MPYSRLLKIGLLATPLILAACSTNLIPGFLRGNTATFEAKEKAHFDFRTPSGWKRESETLTNHGNTLTTLYLPEDESEDNWKSKIVVQFTPTDPDSSLTAMALAKTLKGQYEKQCEFLGWQITTIAPNAVLFAGINYGCGQQGDVTATGKLIKQKEGIYTFQYLADRDQVALKTQEATAKSVEKISLIQNKNA